MGSDSNKLPLVKHYVSSLDLPAGESQQLISKIINSAWKAADEADRGLNQGGMVRSYNQLVGYV